MTVPRSSRIIVTKENWVELDWIEVESLKQGINCQESRRIRSRSTFRFTRQFRVICNGARVPNTSTVRERMIRWITWIGLEWSSGELMEYWSRLFRLLFIENIVCEVEVVLVSCGVWI